MTITQESAQKALDWIIESQKCLAEPYEGMEKYKDSDDYVREVHTTISAALQHFAQPSGDQPVMYTDGEMSREIEDQPSGEGVEQIRQEIEDCFRARVKVALKEFTAKTRYNTVHDAQQAIVDFLCKYLNVGSSENVVRYYERALEPSPASPPDAVIGQAIETLELAIRALRFQKFHTSADECEVALKALRTLPARQDG